MELCCGIFDLDGTLIDSMSMWRELGVNILRARGLEPDSQFSSAMKPLSLREGCAYCKERYGLTESVDEIVESCWDHIRRFYSREAAPMPGLAVFLGRLKARGAKLYVATATDRPLAETALRRAGLLDYFDGLLTCAEAGAGKEHPDIYEQALALSGCAREDTVVFEDALHAIRTAKRAGFRVAAIHDPFIVGDHAEIRRLADNYLMSYEDLLP